MSETVPEPAPVPVSPLPMTAAEPPMMIEAPDAPVVTDIDPLLMAGESANAGPVFTDVPPVMMMEAAATPDVPPVMASDDVFTTMPEHTPYPNLAPFQSIKQVTAGEITEIVAAGCYVKTASGDSVLMIYQDGMTTRYEPKVGDFWVIYDPDGYASISPRDKFIAGYQPLSFSDEPPFPDHIRFEVGHPLELKTWIENWFAWKSRQSS